MRRAVSLPAIAAACLLTGLRPGTAMEIPIMGKVVSVETSYLGGGTTGTPPIPPEVVFTMDVGTGNCLPGQTLRWDGKWSSPADATASIRGTTAGLLAALMSGRQVTFYFDSADSLCVGRHIIFQ